MHESAFQLEPYLRRIGCDAPVRADLVTLTLLHNRQIQTVPFENFDILLGRGASLDPSHLYDKIVNRRRGGYCFELNSIMLEALQATQFEVRPLLARVHTPTRITGREHMINLVHLNGVDYVVDTGFGRDTPGAPLPLKLDTPIQAANGMFRFVDAGTLGTLLQKGAADAWENMYSFDMEHVIPMDIEMGNHFAATHPVSFFFSQRVAVIHTANGVRSLINMILTERGPDGVKETCLEPGARYLQALADGFGIRLDADYDQIKPLPEGI